MQEIRFTVHMAPVAKGRAKRSAHGIAYIPKKTKDAESNILAQAIPYRPAKPFEIRASVEVTFYMPIPKSMRKRDLALAHMDKMIHTKRPDIDNLEKALLDALNTVFWRDDSIVWKKYGQKLYSQNPRIEVTILGE